MEIIDILEKEYSYARCELDYNNAFELLIAVVLSAQTTDKSVNKVTPLLFKKYNNPYDLMIANIDDVKEIIKPIGLSENKSKNIINLSKMLVELFDGIVPNRRDDLMKLPGVGRKTANVVLSEYFKIPAMPVDTHVLRVSKKLGLVSNDADPLKAEKELEKIIDHDKLSNAHLWLLFFGRYCCKAKKPLCDICKLRKFCK